MEVAIITNILTSYREGFLDRLFIRKEVSVTIYCQDSIPGMNLKSIHEKYSNRIHIVKAHSSAGGTIGFQWLPICKIIKNSDVIFLDGNPRILSNIIMGFLPIFFTKKKVVMWTMGHSYGANQITESIRLKWTSFFKNIFLYTDNEIEYLRKRGFKSQYMLGMNNGLDQDKIDHEKQKWNEELLFQWQKENNFINKKIAISLARLTSKNKFEQIILAIPEIVKYNPDFIWCIIGEGLENQKLKTLAKLHNVEKNIRFIGALYKETEIAPYMLSANVFIHPASIGLSIMHAFGYGLPVVVNNETEMHGPEYGAFEDMKTGLNFQANDINDLARKVDQLLNDYVLQKTMRDNCLILVHEKFNVNIMVDRFIKMAKTAT